MDLKRDRVFRFRRSGGREFQSWGAERLKALLSVVLRQAEGFGMLIMYVFKEIFGDV